MKLQFSDLISPSGTTERGTYLFWGILLFALKYNIDRIIAKALFNRNWYIWEYIYPAKHNYSSQQNQTLFFTLLLVAVPFIWMGTVLTLRRLRSAGLTVWLVILFFVPFVNLFLFAILAILPSIKSTTVVDRTQYRSTGIGKLIPESRIGSALLALVLNALSALIFTKFSIQHLSQYGWGLFVGLPFCLGLTSSLIYSYPQKRKWSECAVVALISIGLAGVILFLVAVEGMICLAMAAPLLGVLTLIGATLGYFLQFQSEAAPKLYCVSHLLVIAMIAGHAIHQPEPSLFAVTTSIEIAANPETVWNHVVSFSQLPPPREWIFRTGLAYPVRAEITGRGAGAVRNCIFSTGSFVEPITKWDEPHVLRFSVLQNPAPMQEWTIYDEIHPPHLEGFFISEQGQFRLISISADRTLLEGTTWYHHNLWPESYWRFWSDFIIHRIHLRVLRHIKVLSE